MTRFRIRLSKGTCALLGGCLLLITGCESAYYGAWEKVGVYKRDLLVERVAEAADAQEAAKEEFQSALERFSSVVTIVPSDLKNTYESLADAFEDAESRANRVSNRIDAVENVSADLFDEWAEELELIGSTKLRSSSASQLRASQRQYAGLIRAMRLAESKMEPVLNAFRDQVLYLKHNLNAQAIASLRSELTTIQSDVAILIRDMEASIRKSQAFIEDMEMIGGKS